MSCRSKGVVETRLFTASWSPVGCVAKDRNTVSGCSCSDVDALAPFASVAVSVSARCAGYSWSGAENDPLATPGKDWRGCVWHVDGQCIRTRSHESRLAGTV